jgi:glycosyltransferase involved in cell wall biosynthesis
VKKIWEWLEKRLVPGVDAAYTVCRPIAEIYTATYGVNFAIVLNVPFPEAQTRQGGSPGKDPGEPEVATGTPEAASSEEIIVRRKKNAGDPRLKSRKLPLIIYQGALNKGRGLEQAIRAMELLPEAELIIAGGGDLENELQELVASRGIKNVRFTGRLSAEALRPLTRQAMLGISVEEDLGLNYRYALPNKLFDYIQVRIPVVVSDLPEMSRLVKKYDIGLIAPSHDPEALAATFREALNNDTLRQKWSFNLETAAHELNWDKEKEILKGIFSKFS